MTDKYVNPYRDALYADETEEQYQIGCAWRELEAAKIRSESGQVVAVVGTVTLLLLSGILYCVYQLHKNGWRAL